MRLPAAAPRSSSRIGGFLSDSEADSDVDGRMALTARHQHAIDNDKATTKRSDCRCPLSGVSGGAASGALTRESKRHRLPRSTVALTAYPVGGNSEHSDHDGFEELMQPAQELDGRASDRKS